MPPTAIEAPPGGGGARPRGGRRELSRGAARGRLGLLLLASAALYAVPVWWGLPSREGWAVDEIVPVQVVEPYRWPDKYPPLHRYLLAALGGAVERVAGWLGAPPDSLDHARFLADRLLSTCLAVLVLWLLYRAVRVTADRATALWAAALAAPALPLVYYAKTANLDVPYLFWFALSALFYLRALEGGRTLDYVVLAVAAAGAVATKDQAYGLYVLVPAVLLADLARRRRDAGRSGWGALVDRRLWTAAAAAAGTLALIWAFARDGELSRHLTALTSERAVGRYRIYPATWAGQWRQALQSARHLWAAAGGPVAVAALVGLGVALRRPRRYRAALALGAMALSYYLFFVVPIGYNYVRFFLPVLLVAAVLAAVAARELAAWARLGPVGAAVLALVLLGWPLARAVALDLHMVGDARYAAEAWLRDGGLESRALGLGNERHLPRHIATVEWRRLEDAPCEVLQATESDVLIVDPDEVRGARERSTLAWLSSGLAGYSETRRFENRFASDLFHRSDVEWNLDKITRRLIVYRADGDPCYDAPGVWRRLARVRRGGSLPDRAGLAAAILGGVVETRPLGGDRMSVAGLAPDRWTRGPRPAAVLVRAPRRRPLRPRFDVVAPEVDEEARLWVEDGRSVTAVDLAGRVTTVELPEVGAGSTALFVVWTDAAWSPAGSRRLLGVRLLPARR